MNRLFLKALAILTICIAFAWLLCAQRCLAEKSDVHISKLERVLFERINEDRKSENLPALPLDKTLCKIARAHADDITEADAREALQQLDPLWDELFPAEQARIVALLVERVDIGADGLNVRLRVDGLGGLAREMLTGGIGEAA